MDFVDIGYGAALRTFLVWLGLALFLAFVAQRVCARPEYRRASFRGRPHPVLGWLLAGGILAAFLAWEAPMFLRRFHGVGLTGQLVLLHYPLGRVVTLRRGEIRGSRTVRHFGGRGLWHGKYIVLVTEGGRMWRSIVSPRAERAWRELRRKGLP